MQIIYRKLISTFENPFKDEEIIWKPIGNNMGSFMLPIMMESMIDQEIHRVSQCGLLISLGKPTLFAPDMHHGKLLTLSLSLLSIVYEPSIGTAISVHSMTVVEERQLISM